MGNGVKSAPLSSTQKKHFFLPLMLIDVYNRFMGTDFLSPEFLAKHPAIAVAVSGGPDSMALTHMLAQRCYDTSPRTTVHALTVNHNLRPEAPVEAQQVQSWLKGFPCVQPHILEWHPPALESRIMETARHARYERLHNYCQHQNIPVLYLAHHRDDQAETFLFRLCKGSGLDGLGGMRSEHAYAPDLSLLRPLLHTYDKQDLIEYCQTHAIPYINDPSNQNMKYARPRLRESHDILAQEGLTAKRLDLTAQRLARAKDALEWLTEQTWKTCVARKDQDHVIFDADLFTTAPYDIQVRLLLKAIHHLCPNEDYAPRLEKIEDITNDLTAATPFRKRTLAGLIFQRSEKEIHLFKETKN